MPHVNDNWSHHRLCNAADACLRVATVRTAQAGGRPIERPTDLMGTLIQPQCLDSFTKSEIEEACDFLIRLGFLERRASRHVWLDLDAVAGTRWNPPRNHPGV